MDRNELPQIPGAPGLVVKDGEKVGMLFPTGRLFFGTYSENDNSITWEDDKKKTKMCDEYLWAIMRWLEK